MRYASVRVKRICTIVIVCQIVCALLTSCGYSDSPPYSSQSGTTVNYAESKTITLNDAGITYSGIGIAVDENTYTVIISESGSYVISGALSDGKIVVDTTKEVVLALNGADITSAKTSAVTFINSGKAVIEIVDGTENRLSDGEEKVKKKDTDGDTNAALYSNADIEFRGGGTLYIEGNSRGGIHSNGKIDIASGIFHISVKNQGISAQNGLTVNGGEITIEKSKEGMECKGELAVNGGRIEIAAKDDALNAGTNLVINGGYIYADCEGDGFDSNGDMTINGGVIYIFAGNGKNSPLDVSDGDKIGKFTINGGTIVAGGGASINVEKKSKQGYSWIYPQTQYEGLVDIVSVSGEKIVSVNIPKVCDLFFVSTEKIETGTVYILEFIP